MDQEHGSNIPIRGSISRLSRLPMPRSMASSDNLRLTSRASAVPGTHHDDLRKNSQLPRPAGPKIPTPLVDNFNHSLKSRYDWTGSMRSRSVSPVRDALRDARNASLDTTPPGSNSDAPIFDEGDENPRNLDKDEIRPEATVKRRHRPSLSERAMETLAQISPCPSPTARRLSIAGTDSNMPPPIRPASSMRVSRPTTPAVGRPDSPTKTPFRPPGRSSPTKDTHVLPTIMSPGDIYTPPKAFVRGQRSRIAKPLHESKRSVSTAFEIPPSQTASLRLSNNQSSRVMSRTTYDSKTIASHPVRSKATVASIFKDAPPPVLNSGKLAVSNIDQQKTLLRPRTRGENSIAPSTPPSANSKKMKDHPTIAKVGTHKLEAKDSPKSSAALRETIAKAKAAKRKTMESAEGKSDEPFVESSWPSPFGGDGLSSVVDAKGLMRRRLQQAVTSGSLNIQGLSLRSIPDEVMRLYEVDNSTVNWSEMVDLVKFNAADNEITELGIEIFPDYTMEELTNDEEKTNQFAGLQAIDLHGNLLRQIPLGVRKLERLHTLDLSKNQLGNNSWTVIGQIPNLKELFIGDNLLDGVFDLGDNIPLNLEVLDLRGNKFTALASGTLSQLKSLKTLNCASNSLSTVPWEVLETLPLIDLNMSKNRLSGTLFPSTIAAHHLRNLDVSHNQLDQLSTDELDLPNVRVLNLSGNRLIQIPNLKSCSLLQTLFVSENQLTDIPQGFGELAVLKSADFGYNNIKTIGTEIGHMDNLANLVLAGNPLREKRFLKISTAELKQALERKTDTEHPKTDGDHASTFPASTESIRFKVHNGVLDLSSQNLTFVHIDEIDFDETEGPIHTLKLSNNDLTTFPLELLSHAAVKYSIRALDLSHNPLLDSTGYLSSELFLPNLKSLYIVSTGLTSLDSLTTYLKAPSLSELNISCHRLTGHVPWVRAWWPNCVSLLATDNWFNSVDTEGVRGLEVLDIRNNEIEALPPKIGLLGNYVGSAREPGKLKVLEVSGNKFRVPRLAIVEKGTEAVLRDLRRMISENDVPEEWKEMI